MNFTTLLVVLHLIGTAWSSPVSKGTCPEECTLTGSNIMHPPLLFKHKVDLQKTSVAPWSLEYDTKEDRVPSSIKFAKCTNCTLPDMDPEPIKIQINVYQMMSATTWCKCPYEIAVGCTCVKKPGSS